MNDEVIERDFSFEMNPRGHVISNSLSEGDRNGVLFEGVLSELEELGILEETVSMGRVGSAR